MYGSWKTDISGTSVDSGAVVIGPKPTAPSWICWPPSRSPPRAPEWWWTILTFPPVSSATLSANCCEAWLVPCLGGLTLPRTSSRVCAAAGAARPRATAVARIAIESARAVMGGPPVLAVPVRRLPDGFPEARVVTGEDRAAGQSRDRLQLLDRVERLRRVPDDPGHALLVDVLPPVARVGGEDHRAGLRQLDEQRLVARRVAGGAQGRDARQQLGVAVEQPPAVAGQLEVFPVVEALEDRRGVLRRRVLVLLDAELRGREELRPARVVVVQVREHDDVYVVGLEAERLQPVDEEVLLGEARQRVVAQEARDGARREARVEEEDRVGGADEPAGDRDLDALARELAVEEPRALEAHEAVLQGVQRLDRHGPAILAPPGRWARRLLSAPARARMMGRDERERRSAREQTRDDRRRCRAPGRPARRLSLVGHRH